MADIIDIETHIQAREEQKHLADFAKRLGVLTKRVRDKGPIPYDIAHVLVHKARELLIGDDFTEAEARELIEGFAAEKPAGAALV
jgi:hypothetical protein